MSETQYIKKKIPTEQRKAESEKGPIKSEGIKVLIIGEDGKTKIGNLEMDGSISSNFRKGGRVCKLAMKGKGRAYGKNS